MPYSLSYEELFDYLDNHNLKPNFNKQWCEQNYITLKTTNLPAICSCGNPFEISIPTLRKKTNHFGKRCNSCKKASQGVFYHGLAHSKNYEKLMEELKEVQCEPAFTEEWFNKNYKTKNLKISIVCKCKNTFERSIVSFRKCPYCDMCRTIKVGGKKMDYSVLMKGISKAGGIPNFSETWYEQYYQNTATLLPMVCKACKKAYEGSYNSIKNHKKNICTECFFKKKRIEKYQSMKILLEDKKNTLLTDVDSFLGNYKAYETKIDILCKCGEELTIIYRQKDNVLLCKSCKTKRRKKLREISKESYETMTALDEMNYFN